MKRDTPFISIIVAGAGVSEGIKQTVPSCLIESSETRKQQPPSIQACQQATNIQNVASS